MGLIIKQKRVRVWMIITVVVVILALAANYVLLCVPFVTNSMSLLFGGERIQVLENAASTLYEREYTTKADALAAAQEFVVEVEQEGITLLKNEHAALPLADSGAKVSVFGKNSVNLICSGSGSAGTPSAQKTLFDGLTEAGIDYNPTLRSFYEDNAKSGSGRPANPTSTSGLRLAGFATGETPLSLYGTDVTASYVDYADAAIVVYSRIGGEGFDLPRTMATAFGQNSSVEGAESIERHYLELDSNEKALLEHVKEYFETVIVVLNTGTTMELGELQADPDIDAILWIGFPGSTGALALGQVLTGSVTPSGRTVDTWAADFTKDPSWYNSGVYSGEFGNRYLYDGAVTDYAFVNYMEGIYVGYRYYETRGFEEAKNGDPGWYAENVVYPFGYGLSYTSFDWDASCDLPTDRAISSDDVLTVHVNVTNTGKRVGKDVVQLYYSAPFDYDHPAIEKAQVVLGDFAKTRLLQPGESQVVTLSIPVSDMASYDYADANGNGFVGYELEAGDYQILVASDAHTPRNTFTYRLDEDVQLATRADQDGNEAAVTNAFDDVSAGIFGTNSYASYVSRKDFEGTIPAGYPSDAERTLTPELKETLDASIQAKYAVDDAGKPWEVSGDASIDQEPVNNGLALWDLLYDEEGNFTRVVAYDDPRWEALLDEISVDEMKALVGYGAYRTGAVSGVNGIVNKPLTIDADGPSGFTSFLNSPAIYDTCAYQAECVLGATWNVALAERMGELVGEESLVGNEKGDGLPYTGWYAPAVNIHRSPFGGRNWEYYSEDGLHSGKFAAKLVQGARSKGVNTYVKHFAVNDQETDREFNGILVWANEQAMREIYLKPFELAVKEGHTLGVMSSFNRLGTTWAGGSYALLTKVLRGEWGFHGMVITDYSLNSYTHIDEMIRAGGDLFLTQVAKSFDKSDDATQLTLLRNATRHILYAVVNSNAMSIISGGTLRPLWQEVLFKIDIGLAACLILWGGIALLGAFKKNKIISQ